MHTTFQEKCQQKISLYNSWTLRYDHPQNVYIMYGILGDAIDGGSQSILKIIV